MTVLMSKQEEDARTLSKTEERKENGNTHHLIHTAPILILILILLIMIQLQIQIPHYQIQVPPAMEGVERGGDH